ncbi:MAG: UDP-2,3-diacylglucosamine diphosphatase [Oligoflexia bacterium]|jgi:UDP-2,3-diacylglucosamine hydrolase
MPSPRVHVLSDLHLLDPSEPFYRRILDWLASAPSMQDHVVLAGDIFDVYVGNKSIFRQKHAPFFSAVSSLLRRGVQVHHVEGNHDFWIAQSYLDSDCAKAQVHGDFIEIELVGHKLRVEHGDLADPRDAGYLRLRKFFRGKLGQFLVEVIPGSVLDRIGQVWSNGSRDRQPELPDAWSKTKRDELRSIYFDYAKKRLQLSGANALVMGHCHDPHECPGYMNVGFPRTHGSWVRWTPEENRLERVPFVLNCPQPL